MRSPKILAVPFTIDLSYRHGIAPSWWQLLKALHEIGARIILSPYIGEPVRSLWWESYGNPCKTSIGTLRFFQRRFFERSAGQSLSNELSFCFNLIQNKFAQFAGQAIINRKWRKQIQQILTNDSDIDVIIMFGTPLNQLKGLPTYVRQMFGIPTIFVEGDMPVALPRFSSFGVMGLSYYTGADLSEYDAIVVNSAGVVNELRSKGARPYVVHYGADPDIFSPIDIKQDIDVFFYGWGSKFREKWIQAMITEPSQLLARYYFAVGGPPHTYGVNLGRAKKVGEININKFREYCCRAKVNLNITRESHAEVYASSTARLFELTALGCCVVSNPLNGLEEWFHVGREILVARDANEARQLYEWLIGSSPEKRREMGYKARLRVIRDHSYKNRAKQFLNIIRRVCR